MSATLTAEGRESAPSREPSKGLLDRFLGVFADVRAGEGITASLLMLNIFLLLSAYYLLKTIREPLILTVPGGAEVKSYAAAATAGLLILLVPLYSAVASRVSRVRLINGVTLFFIACLIGFFALSRAGVPIGVAFFIWVGIFSLMVIAQLWAFANDVYTVEQGKRLFAIVGVRRGAGRDRGLVRDRPAGQATRTVSVHARRRWPARHLHVAHEHRRRAGAARPRGCSADRGCPEVRGGRRDGPQRVRRGSRQGTQRFRARLHRSLLCCSSACSCWSTTW